MLCAGVLMIVLDATVVNVALPSIQDDLGFSQTSLAWVVNAYLIAFGGLLLLGGRIGDLIGHRRIFLIGLTVFTAASLLCAVAQTQGMLIAARFVQGAGGALASAVVLGMIMMMFPEPREQAKAIGVYGFVASAGGSIGLLLGGVLTESINWHWIFFINVPIGIATALLARRLVADATRASASRAGADLPGAVLMTSGLMIGVYAILQVSEKGWGSTEVLGLGAVSLALVTAFVLRQARIENPLMPLRLFRSRNVSGANLVLVLLVVGMFGMFFLGALYMQRILGYDPLEVGLAFLPGTIVMGAMSLYLSGPAVDALRREAGRRRSASRRWAPRCCCSRARRSTANYVVDLLPIMLLFGFGAGLAFPALMQLAMSGATPSDMGLASGLANTTPQIGGAVGLAVLATLAADRTETLRANGDSAMAALNGGFHLAYLVGAALVVVAIAVAIAVLKPVPHPMMGHEGEAPAGAREREGEAVYSEA